MAPDFKFFQAAQTPYDFSPIVRGAETAAQIKANAIQSGAEAILRASSQRKEQKFQAEQSAQDRLFKASQRALDQEAADRQAADARSFAFGQAERAHAAHSADVATEQTGWTTRMLNEQVARRQDEIDKENRRLAEPQRIAALKGTA